MKLNIIIIVLLLTIIGWQYLSKRPDVIHTTETVVRDTIIRDTIRDTIFTNIESEIIRIDTLIYRDTINIPIPIQKYEFRDSSYHFVVEGFRVKPISLEFYPTTRYIEKESTNSIYYNERRLSFGLIIGVGGIYNREGVDFGVIYGVGLKIRIGN